MVRNLYIMYKTLEWFGNLLEEYILCHWAVFICAIIDIH